MGYRKAQVSGLDLILALMLFLTVLVLFTVLWDMVHYNVKSSANADLIAIEVANKLLNSPGYPYDWNATNVQVIGLSSERGVIDQAKLENLLDLLNTSRPDFNERYDLVRELLGLGPYQLCINLTDEVGNPIKIGDQNATGGNCNISATSASSVKRTALYGQITVHNNSITFIFDSSGSMGWYSTSIGYGSGNLTSSWVNILNVTYPSSPTDNFDFVMETNDSGGFNGRINVTSPSGIKYGCRDSNPTCTNCGTGCTATHYSGADYMNFTSSRWEAGVWKIYGRKYSYTNPLSYDVMSQTPAKRIDAAKTATNAFVDVVSNESKGVDEMSLYRFNSCNSQRLRDFTTNYALIKSSVNGITATGATPIAQALRDAADYTNASATRNHTMIIVVSDGSETCGGNVVSAADYAVNTKKVERICTVGFAQGSTGEAQLKQAAAIGKCQYYAARNEQELELALKQIYFGQLEKQKVVLNIVVWR
ncbi:MAG: VWA domain-containing protein [Candidatus Micrarchaeota archaeon]|nr:VWA domain-containing protein [Candidatus Micrarchaeota archaeon]